MGRFKHGATLGQTKTRTYRSWAAMKERCNNSKCDAYPHYGGRGITLDPRWDESFAAFLADMGQCPPGMTLERIDRNGHYCKENCKWATVTEQCRNRKSNIRVVYRGRDMCLTEACELAGAKYMMVRKRLKRGWPLEDALHQPAQY